MIIGGCCCDIGSYDEWHCRFNFWPLLLGSACASQAASSLMRLIAVMLVLCLWNLCCKTPAPRFEPTVEDAQVMLLMSY